MKLVIFLILLLLPSCYTQYLYISFHGGNSGTNNIYQYTLQGQYVGKLFPSSSGLDELRGMAVDRTNKLLYFCNAYKDNSFIGVVPQCGGSYSVYGTSHLSHPYGIAITNTQMMYVSNQDGNYDITRFDISKSNSANVFTESSSTPRGVAVDSKGNVYFASEKDHKVEIFNPSGNKINSIKVDTPIGLTIDTNNAVLYVGSNGAYTKAVYAYSLDSLQNVATYTHSSLGHPAGIAVTSGLIYVLDQDNTNLRAWNVASEHYLGVVISNLPDTPEGLAVVTGC